MKKLILTTVLFCTMNVQGQSLSKYESNIAHFTVGSTISLFSQSLVLKIAKKNVKKKTFYVGLGTALLAGGVKELYDMSKLKKTTTPRNVIYRESIKDFTLTSLGGLTSTLCVRWTYKF